MKIAVCYRCDGKFVIPNGCNVREADLRCGGCFGGKMYITETTLEEYKDDWGE